MHYFGEKKGEYTVTAKINGAEMPFAPKIVVVPGPASAENFVLSISSSLAQAGRPYVFYILSRDAFGNEILDGGIEFRGYLTGPQHVDAVVSDLGNGAYSVNFTATKAGQYTPSVVRVSNGKHVSTTVQDADGNFVKRYVTVRPAATSAANSQALCSAASLLCGANRLKDSSVSCLECGLTDSTAGATVGFSLQTKDVYENDCENEGDYGRISVSIAREGAANAAATTVVNKGSGRYEITYDLTVKGMYTLDVFFDSVKVNGGHAAFEVFEAQAHSGSSSVSGPGVSGVIVAGKATNFTIVSKDKSGNRLRAGGERFHVEIGRVLNPTTGDVAFISDSQHDIDDNHDGTYSVSYTVYGAGVYKVFVSLAGEQVAGSPFVSTAVAAGTAASTSYIEPPCAGRLCTTIVAGHNYTLQLVLKDSFDNRREVGGDMVAVELSGPGSVGCTSAVRDLATGVFEISLHPVKTGELRGRFSIGSAFVDYTLSADVIPAALSLPYCSVKVTTASPVVAGNPFIVELDARDVFNNSRRAFNGDVFNVTACLVGSVGARGTCAALQSSLPNNGAGVHTYGFRPIKVGTYSVFAVLYGEVGAVSNGNGQESITVVHAAIDTTKIAVTGAGRTAGEAGAVVSFTIQAVDEFSNAYKGAASSIAVEVTPVGFETSSSLLPNAAVSESSPGTYRASYVRKVAGKYDVHVYVKGNEIEQGRSTLVVSPSVLNSKMCNVGRGAPFSASTVLPSGVSTAVAGAQDLVFGVRLRDSFGNLEPAGIAGRTVSYRVTFVDCAARSVCASFGTLTSASTPASTVVPGGEEFSPVRVHGLFYKGLYTVEILVNGEHVSGSPFAVRVYSAPAHLNGTVFETGAQRVATLEAGVVYHQATFHARDAYDNLIQRDDIAYSSYSTDHFRVVGTLVTRDATPSRVIIDSAGGVALKGKAVVNTTSLFAAGASRADIVAAVDPNSQLFAPQSLLDGARLVDNTDGSYELWYAVRSSGTWLVEIQFRESGAGSSAPFASATRLAQYLQVHATSVSATESVMTAVPQEVVAGTESSAQVRLRDRFGNDILHGGHNVSFEIKALTIDETGIMADSVKVPGRVVDLSTGEYKGFFTMPLSGSYDLASLVTQDSGRKVAAREFRIRAKSASCGSDAPFRCPDRSCKISYAACAGGSSNITVCPPPGRPSDVAKCHDGSCVSNAALCPCPNGTFKCPAISSGQAIARCVATITECPVPKTCSAEYPFLCSDGNCRASESDCPQAVSCPPTMVACPDGISCADSAAGKFSFEGKR